MVQTNPSRSASSVAPPALRGLQSDYWSHNRMMLQSHAERRTSPRVAVDFAVFYDYSLANRPKTKLLDVSIEGAGLEALDPAPVGAVTSFVFVTHGFQAIPCQAKVLSVRPLTDGKYRLGVRFLRLSEEGKQIVTEVIQSATRGN